MATKPLTAEQLAAHLGVSRRTVFYWLKAKRIPALRLNRCVRFVLRDVEAAMRKK